jgi:hypothetical protein
MRFMMIVKASPESEVGEMPGPEVFEEMAKYNQQLVDAGLMLAAEGLHPSSKGARIRYEGKKRTVTDGPFAETKELIAGFWLLDIPSWEEALEWARKVPFEDGEVELRQIAEWQDFGDALPQEVREQEERQRAEVQQRQRR